VTNTAYFIGAADYALYGDSRKCPYPEGTEERAAWIKGWGRAMRRDEAAKAGVPWGKVGRGKLTGDARRDEAVQRFTRMSRLRIQRVIAK